MIDKPAAHQPLSGIRVVEIGTSVAAPYAAWILGALGAQIIKVERPGTGDDARQWGRMFPDGRSSYFLAMTHQSLGNNAEAKEWFDKAVEASDAQLGNQDQQTAVPWNRRLTLELLRIEAEERLRSPDEAL